MTELSRRQLLQGAGLLSGAALLAACGTGTAPRAGVAATGVGTTQPIRLTDQRDKTIMLPHPARRVVTIPMPAASILVAVDQGPEHLVGMHNASWQAMKEGILGRIFPKALAIPHGVADNSFVPNVEGVLALRPDLVVQWADDGAQVIAPLENAGLSVLGLTYGTLDDVKTWITDFATALGRPDRATVLDNGLAEGERTMTAFGRARHKPGPKVLYFNRFTGGLKVAGAGTFNDEYIRMVGAQIPASGPDGAPGKGMVGIDPEQVLAWDPDIVLLGNFDAALPADLYGAPVWSTLRAVKEHQVYKCPLGGYRWDPPSHESPLMWRWLAMLAFPGAEPHDLRADVVAAYKTFYAYSPTPEDLDEILQLKANDGSAHYAQFHAS
jgi:iron complex transport system substrate-binding protein